MDVDVDVDTMLLLMVTQLLLNRRQFVRGI